MQVTRITRVTIYKMKNDLRSYARCLVLNEHSAGSNTNNA